jgi:CRISPR/Cas system endoribonuclease Cas6 (RAMP superfamily)
MAQNNFDKAEFQKKIKNNVKRLYRKTIEEASEQQLFQAVSYAVKDEIIDNLKAQIVKLESTIAKLKGEDLSDYFVIGVADDSKKSRKRI